MTMETLLRGQLGGALAQCVAMCGPLTANARSESTNAPWFTC